MDFKPHHAIKLELKDFGIDHGYADDKHWQALPETLRRQIDEFNKLPKASKDTALSLMRERMERDPKVAEQYIK